METANKQNWDKQRLFVTGYIVISGFQGTATDFERDVFTMFGIAAKEKPWSTTLYIAMNNSNITNDSNYPKDPDYIEGGLRFVVRPPHSINPDQLYVYNHYLTYIAGRLTAIDYEAPLEASFRMEIQTQDTDFRNPKGDEAYKVRMSHVDRVMGRTKR